MLVSYEKKSDEEQTIGSGNSIKRTVRYRVSDPVSSFENISDGYETPFNRDRLDSEAFSTNSIDEETTNFMRKKHITSTKEMILPVTLTNFSFKKSEQVTKVEEPLKVFEKPKLERDELALTKSLLEENALIKADNREIQRQLSVSEAEVKSLTNEITLWNQRAGIYDDKIAIYEAKLRDQSEMLKEMESLKAKCLSLEQRLAGTVSSDVHSLVVEELYRLKNPEGPCLNPKCIEEKETLCEEVDTFASKLETLTFDFKELSNEYDLLLQKSNSDLHKSKTDRSDEIYEIDEMKDSLNEDDGYYNQENQIDNSDREDINEIEEMEVLSEIVEDPVIELQMQSIRVLEEKLESLIAQHKHCNPRLEISKAKLFESQMRNVFLISEIERIRLTGYHR